MDPVNFTYWLNGFAELHGDEPPTAAQWQLIREHLALVFEKVTPLSPARVPKDELSGLFPDILEVLRWPPQSPVRDDFRYLRKPQVRCSTSRTFC